MKKLIVLLIVSTVFTVAKAQQSPKLLTPLNPLLGLKNNGFIPSDSLLKLRPGKALAETPVIKHDEIAFYSKMPVLKLGASTDKMPVAKIDNSGNYTMLIKKVEINPAAAEVKVQP